MANTQKIIESDSEDAPLTSSEAAENSSETDEPKEENPNIDLTSNDEKSSEEDKEPTVKEAESNVEVAGSSSDDKSEEKTEENEDPKTDSAQSTSKLSTKEENSSGDETLIDIEDPDDYLLYLETILVKIHTRFYAYYDETKQVS